MTLLEPIIALAIGMATGAIAMLLKGSRAAQTFLKYGPIVKQAYDVIDPVLDQNLRNWNGSQVDRAFELAIEAVADKSLTPAEIKDIAFFMAKEWLPQKAADKVRQMEASSSPELQLANQVADKVNSFIN